LKKPREAFARAGKDVPEKPKALDLFCGAGGAGMGLHRAGFDVVGVDIRPQPRYPFRFVQGDALAPALDLASFDFVWASPHCQPYSQARNMRTTHPKPEQIPQVRALLAGAPGLTCIENVPRSPLRVDLRLDGTMFGIKVIRERWFELNFFCLGPVVDRPRGLLYKGYLSVIGHGTPPYMRARGIRYGVADCRAAMGIPWMSRAELSQAVPPAYAEFIGRAAMRHMGRA
jgi:DNA (cytosine-5)-methyltransferase 1